MHVTDFTESNVIVAEFQEEFISVPAFGDAEEKTLTYCFSLSKEDIERVIKSRKIYFKQHVGDADMQPVRPSTLKSELIPGGIDD